MHICGVCFQDSSIHPGRCDEEKCYDADVIHWPALCCPGCLCRSYEETHERERAGVNGL